MSHCAAHYLNTHYLKFITHYIDDFNNEEINTSENVHMGRYNDYIC